MKNKQIIITGDIYGYGLRFSMMQIAYKLRINGFTQYISDRDLLVECEGEDENIEQFIEWFWNGPLTIFISGITIYESTLKDHQSFEIRKGFEIDGTKIVWPSEHEKTDGVKGWLRYIFKSQC